jgi:hypothetical protein
MDVRDGTLSAEPVDKVEARIFARHAGARSLLVNHLDTAGSSKVIYVSQLRWAPELEEGGRLTLVTDGDESAFSLLSEAEAGELSRSIKASY